MKKDLQEIRNNPGKCVFLLLLPSGEERLLPSREETRDDRKNRYIDEVNRIIDRENLRGRIGSDRNEDIAFENANNIGIHIHYWEFTKKIHNSKSQI
ncbi:MAG TPA: hypothetical protein P5065_00660 [Candidatus Ratteibacteria bacterium]|jgi:hypothetical protein|nr:hypothetical protein [bacterium]HON05786.1 hypothetical protein [bacterium]HRS05540.1 hypothetical protein [Candidatus Ratteibacteria bacterium]HRV03619.1 hypothetical protein [Candidatus Ratteibacteria bacterium]